MTFIFVSSLPGLALVEDFGSQKVEAGGKDVTGIDDLPPPPKEINLVL